MHVFVWHDAVCKPLQPPYDGPYHVLKWADKLYTLEVANRQEVVSLNRLKPAYMEYDLISDMNAHAAQPTKLPEMVARSGQQVRRPLRFS